MAMRGAHVRKRNHKDGSHSWQIIIERPVDPVTGKRERIYKSVKGTKKEAERIMRDMMGDVETDSYIKDSNLSVEKFLREWHENFISPHKSPTTSSTYLYNLERYIIPRFGRLKLQGGLTTIDIQRWINDLSVKSPISNRPLTPKSIRNLYMNLNAALKRAVLLGYISKNPAENIELPKCKKYTAEVYSADELQKLFEAVRGSELEAGVMLLVCLGIRRGELMGLTWADIDFDKKLVNINKNVVRVKRGESVTKDPKSEAGKRLIEAPDVLIDFLRREQLACRNRMFRLGKNYHDHNLIVCQPNGKPYDVDYFTHKFKQFLAREGLKIIRLHDLRHSHATYMLRLGVNIKAMQKRMGHSTFSTTMDVYSHVLDDMGREAADTLNSGLQGIVVPIGTKVI